MKNSIPVMRLTVDRFIALSGPDSRLTVPPATRSLIERSAKAVENIVANKVPVYGVNTGIGDLCDVYLSGDKLAELQENIIMSHACGGEPYFADDIARGAFFLVVNARAKGYSGITAGAIQKLVALYDHGVTPLLPMQGSLGASGDLIPLAHLALPLLGKGNVRVNGKTVPAKTLLKDLGIAHTLAPKEALSLINGTEVTTSQAAFAVHGAERFLDVSVRATAALFEIFGARTSSIDPDIHALKPHPGQVLVAKNLRRYLRGSALLDQPKAKAQDPYVIRCTPQVDGAILGEIMHTKSTVEIELNSVTDNPLFFVEGGKVKALSGGNFHAQALAFALDSLAIALTAGSKVIERRVERLLNSSLSGLPPFLIFESGTNSGLMIPHYLIAALVAENSVLAHPASIQTLPVSANQEDFVSMAMTAATKAAQILKNCERILAIELLLVAQAMDLMVEQKAVKLSSFSRSARGIKETVRRSVPALKKDRLVSGDIDAILTHLRNGDFLVS